MDKFRAQLRLTRDAAQILATLPISTRRGILRTLASRLKYKKKDLLRANKRDIEKAKKRGRNNAFIDRLTLTDKRFNSMLVQVKNIARSRDVLHRVIESRRLPQGMILKKISVPLGVIGIIYESRPNVTIDVAALCIMSGNAAVLKGGSDALNTNRLLSRCVQYSLKRRGAPQAAVNFLDTKDRSVVEALVKENEYIDVVIPRGGYELVRKIVRQSRIPILYHAEGGARIYVDKHADLRKAIQICINAKTDHPATCNSVDTVLVHGKIARRFIPEMVRVFKSEGVEVRGDPESKRFAKIHSANASDYSAEFLDRIVVLKVVKSTEEAIAFIRRFSKKHTEGIVSRNKKTVAAFVNSIDAAGIFVNCSTRLHDGGIFGLGAEMGIATGKLHARGPVGLKELATYKWVMYGSGQIRN
ncbi:MAG: Gamma-glutamyl phosphate reductase [Parcubacteria group bacterium Gr01-1014_8]|nr:MAG: Gamma-glutamyl phosphate reductase [Parcubacteria group bacterium Gr01-1014_8]